MRVERIYDWKIGEGFVEHDPQTLDPELQADGTIRIGHLSDTHLGKGTSGGRRPQMRRWLETFEGLGADVIVHSGDLVELPDDDESIDAAFSAIDTVDIPVFGVPGNHDVKQPGSVDRVVEQWGPFPRVESVGRLEILLVDSMRWPGVDDRSEREHRAARAAGVYTAGGVGPNQRQQLIDQLDRPSDATRLLVVHHHLRQPVPPKPWYEENADLMAPLGDADQLLALARDHGVRLILHGHRHQYLPPYAPFSELVIINGDSSTPATSPRRARIVDLDVDSDAMRIWELVRY